MIEVNKLKFAIPAKGRLMEPTIALLHKAGYKFRAKGRNLYATCTNDDIVFIFIRPDDIPVLVDKGVVDLGITGSDLVIEKNADVAEVLPLGFGKCRLCLAVKNTSKFEKLSDFKDGVIATSFVNITSKFFKDNKVDVKCIGMNGSVEITIDLNLAEAIVDIVETGDSLRDNNLKVFCDIGNYETVLIANRKLSQNSKIEQIARRINGILIAEKYSLLEYNIKEESLKKAEKITPGFESPTVSKLEQDGWVAVKVMVMKKDVISVMDSLEQIGATGIIETEVRNCRL
jgi:ATP phosphoribosyltransferase